MTEPEPIYPDRVIDLTEGADPFTAALLLPDRPGVEWLVFGVPVAANRLDDPRHAPRQIAVDAGAAARTTVERIVHDAVLARRHG